MADIDLTVLARQMERLLTEMQGMREEMGSIYAELNSIARRDTRALHHGASGWLRAIHGALRNIWIA